MASDEMLQAITKHLAEDAEKFSELRARFEGCDSFRSDAAAAIGYLIAKDELEAAKEEEEEPDVYDEVVAILEHFGNWTTTHSTHTTVDEIFTLIYEWLDKGMAAKGWSSASTVRAIPEKLFRPFIISKPKA